MIRFIAILFFITCSVISSFAQIKTEEITINNAAIQLPGTLSYVNNKSPLIIWVHGSGGVNRDGNRPQYIKKFREKITKKGISFFSFDKRTANQSNITFIQEDGIIFSDFVDDIKVIVNHFKDDNRFSEIILVGHSQGSLVGMLALENVDKYISLAGAGETIDKTIIRQVTKQNPKFGKLTARYFKELVETGTVKNVDPNLMSLFAKHNLLFLETWLDLNPVEEIKKVTIPTLIINGDKDLQVPIEDAKNLHKANKNTKLIIIKNMNHLLKDIQKDEDNLKSYGDPNFKISEELIVTITNFIKNKLTSKS